MWIIGERKQNDQAECGERNYIRKVCWGEFGG